MIREKKFFSNKKKFFSNFFSQTVEWPTCLMSVSNLADQAKKNTIDGGTFEECFQGCKAALAQDCTYWTYNFTDLSCKYYSIMSASGAATDVLSGEKYCAGGCKSRFHIF